MLQRDTLTTHCEVLINSTYHFRRYKHHYNKWRNNLLELSGQHGITVDPDAMSEIDEEDFFVNEPKSSTNDRGEVSISKE